MADVSELHSAEAERALLAVVMNTAAVDGVGPARLLLEREQLQASDFHLPAHGAVYRAILSLLSQGVPADSVNLFDAVRSSADVMNAGGLAWLMGLASSGDALLVSSFPGFARTVRELSLRRRVVSQARLLSITAADLAVDVGQTLAAGNRALAGIVYRRDTFRTLTEVTTDVEQELVRSQEIGAEKRLLSTGIAKLDKLIGGLPPTLIVIGARPGTGKSALAATLIQQTAMAGIKSALVSLEDKAPWLAYRLVSGASGVANMKLRFMKLTDEEYVAAGQGFSEIYRYSDNVLVDDRRRMTATDIVQSARNMIVNHGVKALWIDHLLEVKLPGTGGRRDVEIGDALSQFRDVANEYEVPVVVFTQLNRGAEGKESPGLSDFKDSGSIDEMARVLIALTRKDDVMGMNVIKNTNGVLGRVEVEFEGAAAMVAATEKQRSLYDE